MSDDRTLMFQVQSGQLDKLGVLYEQNKVALYNYFLRTGNSSAASEDLVQETFMKILAYRSSFNGSASFRSWMFGIARNTMADYYRKHKGAHQHVDIDDVSLSGGPSLTDDMQKAQQHTLFDKALAALDAEAREILILSRFHHLNYDEIARLVGCNINTLKSRMRKALNVLQENYQQLASEVGS